jgi:hypothetical protein
MSLTDAEGAEAKAGRKSGSDCISTLMRSTTKEQYIFSAKIVL